LATTDPQKIPVTVLSRCLQFNLKQIPQSQIAGHLKNILAQENIPSDAVSLQLIARAAQGSMRDALSLLDQAIAFGEGNIEETGVRGMLGIIDQSYLFDLLEALARRNGAQLMALADEMEAQCLSFDAALQELAAVLHRIALAQTVPHAISGDTPEYARIFALTKTLPPDDVQLFYQIALHGRSDLSLAPDEYAGFTMTLLRMLTFMPDDLTANRQPPQTAPASFTPADPGENKPQTATAQSAASPAAPASTLDWPQLSQQLKLTGMAKMLAQHSEAKTLTGEKIELCVPDVHKHLLEKKYQDKIQVALQTYFGKPVALNFSIGSITGLTPVALQQREEEEKQAQAIAAIETDPVVQELIEQFDAKLIVSSIKPIEK
jgi:DNA polymerase-3 subunit gamma/tau